MSAEDERHMTRAIELARQPGYTSPNPRVGAVVVRAGAVVAEGAHEGAGAPHAEAAALEGTDARDATLYVTLEPCAHSGRTPPCAPSIVEAGIARVVAAMADPDERTRGRGFDYLRARGVEVTIGVLEDRARRLNRRWTHQRITKRPWVTLKLALSVDGRLAAPDGSSRWITGPGARADVHARRLEADAVMVGAGTVVADDPSLTARSAAAPRQSATIVVDARGRVAPHARLFANDRVVIVTTDEAPPDVCLGWKNAGAEVLVVPGSSGGVDLAAMLDELGGGVGSHDNLVEVYCEGGAALATSLLAGGLIDRLELWHGAVALGAPGPALGSLGVCSMADAARLSLVEVRRVDDDILTVYETGRSGGTEA